MGQMSAQQLQGSFGGLVRHQAEIHLGAGTRRLDGLAAATLVARGQPADRAGRLEHLSHQQIYTAAQALEEIAQARMDSLIFGSSCTP